MTVLVQVVGVAKDSVKASFKADAVTLSFAATAAKDGEATSPTKKEEQKYHLLLRPSGALAPEKCRFDVAGRNMIVVLYKAPATASSSSSSSLWEPCFLPTTDADYDAAFPQLAAAAAAAAAAEEETKQQKKKQKQQQKKKKQKKKKKEAAAAAAAAAAAEEGSEEGGVSESAALKLVRQSEKASAVAAADKPVSELPKSFQWKKIKLLDLAYSIESNAPNNKKHNYQYQQSNGSCSQFRPPGAGMTSELPTPPAALSSSSSSLSASSSAESSSSSSSSSSSLRAGGADVVQELAQFESTSWLALDCKVVESRING